MFAEFDQDIDTVTQKVGALRKTKKDVLADMLRDAILSGELEPGARLFQEQLAERYEVSPTPVREAIQQLVAEGALRHSPYKGVQVAEVNLAEAREIYLIRAALEGLATRLAVPNLRISEIQRLHAIQAEISTLAEDGDVALIRKLNFEFHMLIYAAADAPQLNHIIKSLWVKSPWDTLGVIPNRPGMIVQEHQSVIDAIARGNAEQAGAAMKAHIERVEISLSEYLSRNPGATRTSAK